MRARRSGIPYVYRADIVEPTNHYELCSRANSGQREPLVHRRVIEADHLDGVELDVDADLLAAC